MSDASLKLPAPFGKYLLTNLIAVGGMAEVYRARIFGASGFEKDMVVKRILPRFAQNPSFVQMLIDEAKIAVSLSHGNIVPIYELGEIDGGYYIAMEFVEGRTILDILRDAHTRKVPIPWAHCVGIAAEVARGLAYAHTRADNAGRPLGLIHRDINPRNIVITRGGEVKILDFGIARASTKRHQTASGVIKGTPGYMSPEQMYGHSIDQRSDLFCVGIMLFELLTLRRLFPVWDVAEMRLVYEAGPIPVPSSLVPGIPAEVDAVVMKALAPKIDDRYRSAADLEEDLRTAIARSGVAVTASGLARTLQAIDDAPGPGGSRTQPGAGAGTGTGTAPMVSALHTKSPGVAARHDAVTAAASAETSSRVVVQPRSLGSTGGGPGQAPPKTQPMPAPKPPADLDAPHSFVISLAEPPGGPARAPEPLPAVPPTNVAASHPRTQVLAINQGLAWSQNIGNDAEMLAIAKAMGTAPGQGRRTLLVAAGVAVVGLVVGGVFFGDEVKGMVTRALTGRSQALGVIVVKTRPSPEDIILDGKSRGGGNKKITNVDVDVPHALVVKPRGMAEIRVDIAPTDFKDDEGTRTWTLERDLLAPPVTPDGGLK
jgi:tRNA A-37 threonylcarbamoyl transferase component Bud32